MLQETGKEEIAGTAPGKGERDNGVKADGTRTPLSAQTTKDLGRGVKKTPEPFWPRLALTITSGSQHKETGMVATGSIQHQHQRRVTLATELHLLPYFAWAALPAPSSLLAKSKLSSAHPSDRPALSLRRLGRRNTAYLVPASSLPFGR